MVICVNSSSVTGILIVLIACLISFDPYTRVQEEPVFEDAPVMRISETFDSRFQMADLQKTSTAYFSSRSEEPELLVTMELKDVELKDAFSMIASEVGIPIFTVGPVEGIVDVNVSDVSLERVLEMLTLQHGCDFVRLEDRILVGAASSRLLARSKISYTIVFKPRFVSAGDIGAVLSDVYAPYVKTFDEFLMVTAPFSTLKRIQEDIAMLDIPRKQIVLDILALKVPIEIHPELDVRLAGTYLTRYSSGIVRERFGYHVREGMQPHTDLVESLVHDNSVPLYALTRVVVNEGVESYIRLLWKPADSIGVGDERSPTTLIFMGHTIDDDSIVLRLSLPLMVESAQDNRVLGEAKGYVWTVESRDIVVRSGELVVLGGLLGKEQVSRTSHVPLLRELPLAGHLFQWKYGAYTDMETVVVIRPTIQDAF